MKFFNALNCYTDASVSMYKGRNVSCAGYVLVYRGEIIDYGVKIIPKSTNNEGEVMAVFMGVQALIAFKHLEYSAMNLFSDSRITIDGLNIWSKNWVKNQTPDFILLSSSGKPVANQDIFKFIINSICYNKLNINFWHQLGHKNCKSTVDIESTIEAFRNEYGYNIPIEIAQDMCYYNDMVDNNTRNVLIDSIKTKSIDKEMRFEIPCIGILTEEKMDKYFNYIGGA